MTSLHVICGLAPFPIKNPGYASSLLYSWLVWLTIIMILYQKTALKQPKINFQLFAYFLTNECGAKFVKI